MDYISRSSRSQRSNKHERNMPPTVGHSKLPVRSGVQSNMENEHQTIDSKYIEKSSRLGRGQNPGESEHTGSGRAYNDPSNKELQASSSATHSSEGKVSAAVAKRSHSKGKERKKYTAFNEVESSHSVCSPQLFLPPSHFAMAAGMRYLHGGGQQETGSSIQTSYMGRYGGDNSNENAIPISYPSRPPSPLTEEFHMINRASTRGTSTPESTADHEVFDKSQAEAKPQRRSSQLGLPELEKDLLPSLKDTVERMTRSSATPSPNLGSEPGSRSYRHFSRMTPRFLISPSNLSERSSSLSRSHSPSTFSPDAGSQPGASDHKSKTVSTIEQARRNELAKGSAISVPATCDALRSPALDSTGKPKSILKNRSASKSPRMDNATTTDEIENSYERTRTLSRQREDSSVQHHFSGSPLLSTGSAPASGFRCRKTVERASSDNAERRAENRNRVHDDGEHLYMQSQQAMQPAWPAKTGKLSHRADRQLSIPNSPDPYSNRGEKVSRLPVVQKSNRRRRSNDAAATKPDVDARKKMDQSVALESESDEREWSDEQAHIHPSRVVHRGRPSHGSARRSRSRSTRDDQDATPRVHFSEHISKSPRCDSDESRVRRQCDLANLVAGMHGCSTSNEAESLWDNTSNAANTSSSSMRTDRSAGRRRSHSFTGVQTNRDEGIGLAYGGSAATLQSLDKTYYSEKRQSRATRRSSSLSGERSSGNFRRSRQHSGSRERSAAVDNVSSVRGSAHAIHRSSFLSPSALAEDDPAKRDSFMLLNAKRQRQAFGIPPSSSDSLDEGIVSGESQYSIADETVRADEDAGAGRIGLSSAAESMFQSLGSLGNDSSSAEGLHALSRAAHTRSRPPSPDSTSDAESSAACDDMPHGTWHDSTPNLERATWRDTLSDSAFASLNERYGKTEMSRQEVIWDLCEREHYLVKHLHTALQVYVHPLLGKDRQWINGLPTLITRLLDWLDDIFQLHSQIHSTLRQLRSSQYPVILRVAESLRPFIPRLEIYQPYVARLDEVLSMIDSLVRNETNDLGEFIRIQNSSQANISMDMSSYLRLPTKRLGEYLDTFQRMLLLTPNTHVDHLPTFSLFHSATMVVNVMWEVKLREEEYGFVKDVSQRIHGLPDAAQLARRERRVLAHGPLQRIHLSERARRKLEESTNHLNMGGTTPWTGHMTGSGSDSSVSGTPSLSSQIVHQDMYSPRLRASPQPQHEGNESPEKPKSTLIYAFIFTDLILFTIPIIDTTGPRSRQYSWRLPGDIGMCRILSAKYCADCMGYDHLMELTVLPVKLDGIESGILADNPPTPVYLHVPRIPTGASGETQPSAGFSHAQGGRERWLNAIKQCHDHTLRSLSFPSHSGHFLAHGPSVDLEHDTQQSVMSLISSGLPLPKSPSLQIEELHKCDQVVEPTLHEREERGWWALRYQQVLREMQRHTAMSTINYDSTPKYHRALNVAPCSQKSSPRTFLSPPSNGNR